jgi:hypothetical protein
MIETVGIIVGIGLGLFGSLFSVIQFLSQKKLEEKRDHIEEKRDHIEEMRDKEQKRQARLDFLVNVIIDEDIPRDSRKIFYEEYVALGGNGTLNKFWLRGGKMNK